MYSIRIYEYKTFYAKVLAGHQVNNGRIGMDNTNPDSGYDQTDLQLGFVEVNVLTAQKHGPHRKVKKLADQTEFPADFSFRFTFAKDQKVYRLSRPNNREIAVPF